MSGRGDPIRIILLWPVSFIYGLVVVIRNFLYDHRFLKIRRAGIPVISVGNLVAGGTGKTPGALMLAQLLGEMGHRPAIVSRGYRRKLVSPEPILVSDGGQIFCSPDVAGDEPYLLAKKLLGQKVLIIVARDRLAGAVLAKRSGADVVILDDGFQHRRLWRDMDILLLDCRQPFDNGWLLPAGMLREPRSALGRADVLLFTRCQAGRMPDPGSHRKSSLPLLTSRHVPGPLWRIDAWRQGAAGVSPRIIHRPVMLFSGLAKPESFERSAAELGLKIAGHLRFPDHHRYRSSDLQRLEEAGRNTGVLVTTEKDASRLPADWQPQPEVYVLGVSLQLSSQEQWTTLRAIIQERIS